MNEMIMQYVRDYGTKALMSLMATFAGCPSMGCASLKSLNIGEVSEKPVVELTVPGATLTIYGVAITATSEVDEETPETPSDGG